MADKSFGVKELNLLNASGTPTVTSPNNLNLNANTVAISTSCTIGNNLTVTGGTSLSNLLVSGITTFTAGNTVDVRGNFTVSGISTIPQPADSNPMANWTITNNSASAYRFTGPGQSGTEDNPNIYLVRGHRYIFKHNATSSHPIQIRFANGGAAYTDGITYSDTSNNRTTDGNNLIFNVQHDAPAQLFYQCTSHGGMVGNIYIVGGPQVISGVVTATTFVGNLTGTASANAVLTGSTNNQLVTVTGANAITGESALTFDGSTLNLTSASGDARVTLIGTEGNDARLSLVSDDGDDHIDQYNLRVDASDNSFFIDQFESGSFIQRFRIANGGKIVMGNSTTSTTQLDIRFTDTTAYSATDNRPNGLKIFNDSNTDNGFAGIELGATDGDDYYGSTLLKSIADGTNYSNDFAIQTRHSGNYAERLRIKADGDIGVGVASPDGRFHIMGGNLSGAGSVTANSAGDLLVLESNQSDGMSILVANDERANIYFGTTGTNGDVEAGIQYAHEAVSTTADRRAMIFRAGGGERARIQNGNFLVGRTNTITIASDPSNACFEQLTNNGMPLTLHCDQNDQRGFGIYYTSGKNASDFIRCQIANSAKFLVLGNGNCQNANNTYTNISDATLKENIVDANSQWNDIKNIKIRNYNFKASTGHETHTQIGVIAQEVELVAPKLVDSSGKDGIKSVASSVLYMKAVKALQEAMARIETLEAEVAALKGS